MDLQPQLQEEASAAIDRRYRLGPLAISAVNMETALERLDAQVRRGRSAYVCVANVNVTGQCRKNAEFCRIENQSFMTVPDGMPLVWAARLAGEAGVDRVAGPDLMMEVLHRGRQQGYTHYFYGDEEGVLERLTAKVRQQFPGAIVVGSHSPPFREMTQDEVDADVREINRLRPAFVWVALGAPKQERWMASVVGQIESSVLVGVGAAFRFLLGEFKHPPRIVQRLGMEGICWRFLKHPYEETLWYAKHVPMYLLLLTGVLMRRWTRRRH